jgi:two-component system, sensor histidine kinase YesM
MIFGTKRRWKTLTISVLCMISMLPVAFQGYLVGQESTRKIEELYNGAVSRNMESLGINMNNYINYIEDYVRSLSLDKGVIQALQADDKQDKGRLVQEELNSFITLYRLRIPLYTQIIANHDQMYSDVPLHESEINRLNRIIRSFSWYQDLVPYDNTAVYRSVGEDFHDQLQQNNAIYVSKSIVSDNKHLGLVVVQMNQTLIQRLMRQIQINDTTTVFISQDNGEVLITNEENRMDLLELAPNIALRAREASSDYSGFNIAWGGVKYFCALQKLPNLPWYVVSLTPLSMLDSGSRSIWIFTFAAIGVSLLLILFVLYVFTRKVTIPILQLVKTIRNIKFEERTTEIDSRGTQEIEILSSGINQMLERIHRLIEQIKKEERERRDLELNLLQSQIRPHFLHNALNSIRWMAEMKGEKTIARALISLTSMLQYTLSKAPQIWSTISDELGYVKNYIAFQEIRTVQPIETDYHVEESMLAAKIPKLSLQPIVENAILHGFAKPEGRTPKLTISISQEFERVSVKIQDNGCGMDESIVSTLLLGGSRVRGKDDFGDGRLSGIGMANVNRRFELEFGHLYEISIDSVPGRGTVVHLRFPYRQ